MKTDLNPSQCITQIASRLGLDGVVEDHCKNVTEYLRQKELLTGRSPYTIAGVAVYLVTQLFEDNKK
jgi:transcription initiation factor TFIIIB Brf1 subunit/transcription initiation factor TFIIB